LRRRRPRLGGRLGLFSPAIEPLPFPGRGFAGCEAVIRHPLLALAGLDVAHVAVAIVAELGLVPAAALEGIDHAIFSRVGKVDQSVRARLANDHYLVILVAAAVLVAVTAAVIKTGFRWRMQQRGPVHGDHFDRIAVVVDLDAADPFATAFAAARECAGGGSSSSTCGLRERPLRHFHRAKVVSSLVLPRCFTAFFADRCHYL